MGGSNRAVSDNGDTIVVEGQGIRQKVRLSASDTPERDQPWGDSATREMRRLVAGKDVSVYWYKTDRWDRLIGNVLVDGEDAGLLMVERGMAWHFKRYADEQTPADRDAYSAAEKAAQGARRGIWSDPEPIPPWEWRKRQASTLKRTFAEALLPPQPAKKRHSWLREIDCQDASMRWPGQWP